ncbi:hypothetical protein DDZ13_13695 [Coraliomargarita sinensis]|uniref:Sulfotransferase domain-containing protein n=1 Tax=Coraliomargarita sinensis TaxID=2174842 RepID=A0A317ZD72_9BACT|nr:putative capsular polysaccharide synthesis family protein [Coraliomargarita sinensis]PXA03116.1 hypothetical protein DDZ13_13695 [Coraliomargarita sinensis]
MMNPFTLIQRHRKIRRECARIQASIRDDAPIVIIYQMGKVASSSIYHALKQREDCHAFHAHLLGMPRQLNRRRRVADSWANPDKRLRTAKSLWETIIAPRRPAKIITLVRDPFERNISAYFENSKEPKRPHSNRKEFIDRLIRDFLKTSHHSLATDWYQKEFNPTLEIDVFAHPFDTSRKWAQYELEPYDLLVLRTDLPDENKNQVISEFLGLQNLKIRPSNQTHTKSLNPVYADFKKTIRFPKELGTTILNSSYTKHFFSEQEIAAMQAKWIET